MKTYGPTAVWLFLVISMPVWAQPSPPAGPILAGVPPDGLENARERLRAGDAALQPALAALLEDAREALGAGPFSVTHKSIPAPSGDPHDYTSLGPYWWPDPSKPDGLPYIRKDGERNPESLGPGSDSERLSQLRDAVEALSLAYYFTGEERYAEKAAQLIRAWFIDLATRMNPHLQYSQVTRGHDQGRFIGIIDGARFVGIINAVGLIRSSPSWTAADQAALTEWFDAYLTWLLTSPHGIRENRYFNNHGTHFDVQAAAAARFVGKDDVARAIVESSRYVRIDPHIGPDGRQPHELARTRAVSYSTMNLAGMFRLAMMGDDLGLDLWGYEGADGGSMKDALDFILDLTADPEAYPYKQITPAQPSDLLPLLLMARRVWDSDRYARSLQQLASDPDAKKDRAHLYFASPSAP